MINLNFEQLAFEFLNSDISLTKLAKREGTTRLTLAKYFKKLGIKIINKLNHSKFNEHIFDSIDTEEKAYWLGFIYADGYIGSTPLDPNKKSLYNFEISLKESDSKHLLKFNKFVEYTGNNVSISKSHCGERTFKRCRFMISNKYFWNTLNNLGCIPKKSLRLEFPNENIFKSKDLIRHFIRGYFDGDGCFTRHIYYRTVTPAISILGTPNFLTVLYLYININGNFRHDKRHSKNTLILEFNKENGIKFINYLYSNANIYLDRKYKLYNFFKNGSRSIEEFIELLSGNIGETPKMDNTEINSETKEFESSYSVDSETLLRI